MNRWSPVLFLLPARSFWCMDEANRFLQTHDLFSALLIFGSRQPLVIVRRESIGLLFAVLDAANMRYDPLGTGSSRDPLTDVVVFRCRF